MNYPQSSTMASIHAVPGKALAIWALVMAFLIPVVGLVLGVVALVVSRRAGVPHNLATAAVAVSVALLVAAAITSIAIWG